MIALTIVREYNDAAMVVVAIAALIVLACEAKKRWSK